MKTIGIRDLQKNPSIIAKWLEEKEYTLITKRNKPIGITISFDDEIMIKGLKNYLLIEAYEKGLISLGELSNSLNMNKRETMKFLSSLNVNVIDYDFKEDLENIQSLYDS